MWSIVRDTINWLLALALVNEERFQSSRKWVLNTEQLIAFPCADVNIYFLDMNHWVYVAG